MLYLGIDAGGTKTEIQGVDETLESCILFETVGADITSKPAAEVERILREGLERVLETGEPLGGVVIGAPGYGEAESWVRDLETVCRGVFEGVPYRLFNDVELALEAAFPVGAGVLALAGTGSMAYAKDGAGRTCRVGGWGTLFGDEGSAFAVGVAALQAVSREVDGRGPPTALTGRVLEHPSPAGLWQLFPNGTDAARAEVASYARQVEQAASAGDAVAQSILEHAADALLEQAEAARENLDLAPGTSLATLGGMFRSSGYSEHFARRARALEYTLVAPAAGPSLGGARLARSLFGPRVSTSV